MIIVTTNEVAGYATEAVLGEVMGMTVRSANFGANFTASFRSIGGGEVTEYTQLVYESRNEVMNRMWAEAQRRGGNAIIGMRFDTGDIGQAFTEICAYGTAVVVRPLAEGEPGATPQSIHQAGQPGQPAGTGPGGQAPYGQQHFGQRPGGRPVQPRSGQPSQPPSGQPGQPPNDQSEQPTPAPPSWTPQPSQSHQPQPRPSASGPAAPHQSAEPMPRPDTHGYSPQVPPPQERREQQGQQPEDPEHRRPGPWGPGRPGS